MENKLFVNPRYFRFLCMNEFLIKFEFKYLAYSRTSIIRTLSYPNVISNFQIPKDSLVSAKLINEMPV